MSNSSALLRGTLLTLLAASLWGVSGSFAQFLFEQRGIDPEWLVTARLLSAGLILSAIALWEAPAEVKRIFRDPRDFTRLFFFALFGMLAVQYTYFAAIHHSNAATATILQYLGPVFIAIYYSGIERRLPTRLEVLAIALALGGTFLLVTHGDPSQLQISQLGLFWGIASAVALATYSIQPLTLLRTYKASVVIGPAMLIGGALIAPFSGLTRPPGTWDAGTAVSFAFIVLFGTLIAFYAYLTAVRMIGATKASVLACAEPLSAVITGVLWLGTPFALTDWIGTALILLTIAVLTAGDRKEKSDVPRPRDPASL
ncbi:MAG: EamA family transporter [Bdellovibrionaceae bacterium]|nr:EamA family transporter [Pseudobdellovibrionaceae bacterium]